MQDSLNRFFSSKLYKHFLLQSQFAVSSKSKSKSMTTTTKSKSSTQKNNLGIPVMMPQDTSNGPGPVIRNASSYNKIRQQYGFLGDD